MPVGMQMDSPMEEEVEEPRLKLPVIGIIYPPPEVRNIVDKTGSFVARNGPEFETRIRQNELNNPKFNFLNPTDPYHAYYQHKVKEFKEGKALEPSAPKQPLLPPVKPQQDQIKIIEPVVPKEAPAENEFVADPPSISAFDLDVVKLTAQFVARNGRQFLTNLMNREQRNYQFDFLRPQHSLFNYFTKLVEQYTKVLIPPKDLLNKLKKEAANPKEVLDQVKYRVEWAKFQERERRKEQEAAEKERVAYAQVDWHDFVVVETVDFQANEIGNLPPPTTPAEVGARLLAQERYEQVGEDQTVEMEVESDDEEDSDEEDDDEDEEDEDQPPGLTTAQDDIQVQDMEEESDDEEERLKPLSKERPKPPLPPLPVSEIPRPPLPPVPDQVVIKKDYNPKNPKITSAPPSDQFLISPITGEKIPAEKMAEHMRIGLLDPKWIEDRDRAVAEKREQEEVYAPGSAIDSSLKNMAQRRTDIFGSGAEETQIGKKIGEEEHKVQKVVWDGHSASMEKVSQKARENISIEEQIAVIHKVKGLVHDDEKEKIGPAMPKSSSHIINIPHPPSMMDKRPPPPPAPRAPMPPKPPVSAPKPPPPGPMMNTNRMLPMSGQPPQRMMVLPPRPPMQPPPGMRGPHVMGMQRPPMHPPMPPNMPPQHPPRGMGGHGGFMPPRPPHPGPPSHMMDDGPPSKKAKTEDSLIPEAVFLARNKGPVTFRVQVPNMADKGEWKLNGQTLTFTMPLTDAVSVIKAKIHESLGMPAGKQKLQLDGLFIKDSNTLGFYNFMRNSNIQLQVKERGGRKR